jgi:hypothetical protein
MAAEVSGKNKLADLLKNYINRKGKCCWCHICHYQRSLANTGFICVQNGLCGLGKQDFEELRREEMDKFNELYIEWKGLDHAEKDSSFKKIPKFFRKVFIYIY